MSETAAAQQKSATRNESSDQRILAQVDKWLAVIREISGERGTQSNYPR
ncbi:MAG: hypothetical protein P4L80_15285 [Xanthobacteraceae bacterium]|nr:hypothetical protein [Xanthobacteraceae bacterium]